MVNKIDGEAKVLLAIMVFLGLVMPMGLGGVMMMLNRDAMRLEQEFGRAANCQDTREIKSDQAKLAAPLRPPAP